MIEPDLSHRGLPQVGRAARRGAQPCAARHSRRSVCASILATASTWGRGSMIWNSRTSMDIMLKVGAGSYSIEAANPRHEHEWEEWRRRSYRMTRFSCPACIPQSTVLVEHPELVAQRIMRFAEVVGRERVIAGTDCGFARRRRRRGPSVDRLGEARGAGRGRSDGEPGAVGPRGGVRRHETMDKRETRAFAERLMQGLWEPSMRQRSRGSTIATSSGIIASRR